MNGELAQLVERIVCIDKARGSKPRFSNTFSFFFYSFQIRKKAHSANSSATVLKTEAVIFLFVFFFCLFESAEINYLKPMVTVDAADVSLETAARIVESIKHGN